MYKKLIKSVVVAVIVFMSLSCAGEDNLNDKKDITYEELKKIMNEETDYFLIDVRTPEEYASGHIPGAGNIPLSSLSENLPTDDKNYLIIVYCRSGRRSANAYAQLMELGYVNVRDFGGIGNWKDDLEKKQVVF